MTTKSFLGVDLAQLRIVSKYFGMISLEIEHRKDVSLHYPSSVSLADCQFFLDIIIQPKPILPKLLSALHASSVFILADYFCVDLVFEELHVSFTHNLTLSPLFLKLFQIYYSCSHPQTIDFYYAFAESFKIPLCKFSLMTVSSLGMRAIKKIARDYHRRTVHMENLHFARCYICKGKICYTLKFRDDTNNVVYDNTKIIKMPCCATPTHPSCTYYMLYPRSGFKCCTRCKTILHNGQAAYVDFNHSRERMKIRKEYGISTRKLLPPIDVNRFSSYY